MNQKSTQQMRTILLAFLSTLVVIMLTGCVKRSREVSLRTQAEQQSAPGSRSDQVTSNQLFPNFPSRRSSNSQINLQPININTATGERLEELPGIGKALAQRIIEHREKYGLFRRPEHLIIVRGLSDRRFRALRDLITVQ